jgi:hypothetical protein
MSIDYSLVDTFDLDGRWGLQDWPHEKWLHGKMHFDPQLGISLTLDGLLGQMPNQIPCKLDQYPAVFGVTSDSKRVTLLEVTGGLGGLRLGEAGGDISGTYHAMKLVVGEFVPSTSAAKYRSVRVRFHNLEEFFGRHGFEERIDADPPSISYRRPAPIVTRLDGITVTGEFAAGFKGEDFANRQIWQQGWFTIQPEFETEFDLLVREIVASLHYLVELAAGHRLPILQIQASTSRADIEVQDKVIRSPVQLFLAQKRPLPLPEREHPFRMLFTLGAFGTDAAKYLQNWHDAFKSHRNALDFYFSLEPASDAEVGLEHHFLSIVNAFETYHRIAGVTQFDLPESEHNERVTQILAAVPAAHRKWLEQHLEYSNEVRLRRRLREAYDEQPENVRKVLGGRKGFAGSIVDTRNYLTHHSDELKDRSLDVKGMWLAVKRVRLVLQVCFLRKMGLTDQISQIIQRSVDYQILHRHHRELGQSPEEK